MKYLLTAVCFFLCGISADAQSDSQLIQATYQKYKTALIRSNGFAAISVMDSRTITHYDSLLVLVKTADSIQLDRLPAMDKFSVLAVRQLGDRDSIKRMNGRTLILFAIRSGLIGKNSVTDNEIGEIMVEDTTAQAEIISKGVPTGQFLRFYMEYNTWRINTSALMDYLSQNITAIIEKNRTSENEVLLMLVARMSKRPPVPGIWLPLH